VLPCQSHYWVRRGKVRWSRRYSLADRRRVAAE
jgi:hypothetical protein